MTRMTRRVRGSTITRRSLTTANPNCSWRGMVRSSTVPGSAKPTVTSLSRRTDGTLSRCTYVITSSGGAAPVVSMTVVWALPMTGQSTDAASIPPRTCFFMLNLRKPSGELLTTPAALEMFRRPAFTSADVQRVHSQCGLRLWPICTAQRSKEPPGTARYGTKQQNDARPGLNARLSQERRRACWRLQPGWWLTLTIGGDHERLEIHCECTTRPGCAVVGGRSVRRAGAAVCVPPHG